MADQKSIPTPDPFCAHPHIVRSPIPFCNDCGQFVVSMPIEAVSGSAKGIELVKDLRQAAIDIAKRGINGWGNLCSLAADRIEDSERATSLARKEVERLTAENRRLREQQ